MSTTEQIRKPGTGSIGPVRFSYLFVYTPRASKIKPTDDPQYSINCMIPKEANGFCKDPEAIRTKLKGLMSEAATEFFGAKLPELKSIIKDGDADDKHPGYWYFKVKGYRKPVLMDANKLPVTEEAGWESGDWGHVQVFVKGFDEAGNKGVSAWLNAVCFTKKDEPLSGNSFANIAAGFDIPEDELPPQSASQGEYDPFAEK